MGADPLDQWTWRRPLPQGDELKAIAFGNGRFVAVGETSVVTSEDGLRWQLEPAPQAFHFRHVCHGGGVFVALGYHADRTNRLPTDSPFRTSLSFRSVDGIQWNEAPLP